MLEQKKSRFSDEAIAKIQKNARLHLSRLLQSAASHKTQQTAAKTVPALDIFDAEPRLEDIFPEKMETAEFVEKQRRTLVKAIASDTDVVKPNNIKLPKTCDEDESCLSGLCPTCTRSMRKELFVFTHTEKLYQRDWVFLTVRPKAWEIPAGKCRRIRYILGGNTITTLPGIHAFTGRLRRAHKALGDENPPLIVIGSIEAPLRIEGNVPKRKPVHFHLLISGLPRDVIEKCAKGAFEVVNKKSGYIDPRMVHVKSVGQHWEHFFKCLNYSVSQPYIVVNAMNDKTGKTIMITPQSKHLAELASNWGPLSITERLILIGIRREKNGFRLC